MKPAFVLILLLAFSPLHLSAKEPAGLSSEKGAGYSGGVVIKPLLHATTTTIGQPIEYPKTDKPLVTMVLVEIPPGVETGWHMHKMPSCEYILSGSLTVEIQGGKICKYEAGQAFCEIVNTLHNGKNSGTEPVKLLMTVIGEEGVPIATKP